MTSTLLAEHPFAAWFEIDETTLQRVLSEATARGSDFADLFFQHRVFNSVSLEDGIVNRASTGIDRGVGIRVVNDEQTGYAYSESLELDAMLAAARTAAAIAESGQQVVPQAMHVAGAPDRYPIRRPWDEVAATEKLPVLRRVEALAREMEPAVVKVSVTWMDADERMLIASTDTPIYTDRRPMGVLHCSVTAEKNGERQSGSSSLARREDFSWFDEDRMRQVVREALDRTMILFEAKRPPAGEMPVVLAAGASGILLHEAIGHGLEADFNRKGVSIYASMMNQKVAPDFVTIVDDATIEHERGALNVDDEGFEGKRTTLIENGVLRSYMHDRISANHYGVEPTGSGRRQSFRHVPMPRMRCTFMEDGPHGYDEIVSSVEKGIVAETFTNGQVQIGAGDFTFFVKNGWLIEGGKITAPIRNVNIIGNGPEALRNITMAADDGKLDLGGWTCGKEGQSVPVSQGIPTVLVSHLTVGGEDE